MSTTTHSLRFGSTDLETTVVIHESALDEALSSLLCKINESHREKNIVGFGIEKSFKSCESSKFISERVALLKLCAGCTTGCLIVHLIGFSTIPTSLAKFLDLSSLNFVGMRIKQDVADLQRDYGIQVRNAVDLGNLENMSSDFANNANFMNGRVISMLRGKPGRVAFGEWDAVSLSKEQIEYASVDALAAFYVGTRHSGLF